MTYRWQDLSRSQQDTARRIRDKLFGEGWKASVSQIAEHLDEAMEYQRAE